VKSGNGTSVRVKSESILLKRIHNRGLLGSMADAEQDSLGVVYGTTLSLV
jgi:hypothetical protein